MKAEELFKEGFVLLDGAFGTMLQKKISETEKIPELVNITHPEIVQEIHREYIQAGSDVIYACTFGINRYKLEGSGLKVSELVRAGIRNAREAASGTEVKVALDIGPLGRLVEPNGVMTFQEAYDAVQEIVLAGKDADLIVIETQTDLYETRAALIAAKENADLPVICTMSFEENGRTFTGTCIPSMALTLEGLGADAIGINCSLGPSEFKPMVEELASWTRLPLVIKPNAGLPDPGTGEYDVGPEEFAERMMELVPYGIKFLGGCCGTTPEFISSLKKKLSGSVFHRDLPVIPVAVCSPEEVVVIDEPRVIGERINPTGKKKLKEAIKSEDYDYLLDLALNEVDEGAEILDVNAGVPGVDEKAAISSIVRILQGAVTAPLQIDSGDPEAIEAALRINGGKAIVNSVNGEERSLQAVLPIVKKYGACVIGLTLDEEGIPQTAEKRMEIARKITSRAEAQGIPRKDIIIDCLTLTVSAEQENARNTLEAIRQVKETMGLKTVLGVSNISFGLPQRSIINQNFLQMALSYGLDLAIINPGAPGMIQAFDVYKLIMNIDHGAKKYIEKYQNAPEEQAVITEAGKSKTMPKKNRATVEEYGGSQRAMELGYFIENGMEKKCRERVEKELKDTDPLDIINTELIPILDKTGRDFESGKIFIPQLVLCAATCQSAFEVIKKELRKDGSMQASKGVIVIATVKGDVHDIGKNIVKVILENYSYKVIDLGKDVEPQRIVDAVGETGARLVGLSALMTTTLPNMKETIRLIKENYPQCKVMTGGAVLTEEYAVEIGADYYVGDATASCSAAKEVYG